MESCGFNLNLIQPIIVCTSYPTSYHRIVIQSCTLYNYVRNIPLTCIGTFLMSANIFFFHSIHLISSYRYQDILKAVNPGTSSRLGAPSGQVLCRCESHLCCNDCTCGLVYMKLTNCRFIFNIYFVI